jgi:hypothetical protein
MLTDKLMDFLTAPLTWGLTQLPDAQLGPDQLVGAAYADPSTSLQWIQSQGSSVLTGGPGFIFNGGLIVGLLTVMFSIELAVLTFRTVMFVKSQIQAIAGGLA